MPSKLKELTQKAKNLAEKNELSSKREAFAYFVIAGSRKKAERLMSKILELEKKLPNESSRIAIRGIKPRFLTPSESAGISTREYYTAILSEKSLRIIQKVLAGPFKHGDPLKLGADQLMQRIKEEYNPGDKVAFSLALFILDWRTKITEVRKAHL